MKNKKQPLQSIKLELDLIAELRKIKANGELKTISETVRMLIAKFYK